MIEIKVSGQIVSVQETAPLFAGSADIHTCRFTFDKRWKGFRKSAVFRAGAETHTMLLGEDDCCTLPWEMLTRKNIGQQLEVGVYGVSAQTEIITSVWDTLGMIREGTQPSADARNPTDAVYEQIMARLQRIYEAVGIYDEGVRALIQRAETAAQTATESAETAASILEEIRAIQESGIAGVAALTPYCIEYGTLSYNGETTQTMQLNFSQCYSEVPVFLPHADSAALTVSVEPLHSEFGYYGGAVTVRNESGGDIAATITISAYCAYPTDGEREDA
ncbi:MAG: hypothetical protein IKM11_03195 [Oscillospiraceae bacterium]|nr:hypothetical protein [Oscillospiraceae bacterium]